jgi:hypothetical protein
MRRIKYSRLEDDDETDCLYRGCEDKKKREKRYGAREKKEEKKASPKRNEE